MQTQHVIDWVMANKVVIHECRDMTFGDSELFLELPTGVPCGSGYKAYRIDKSGLIHGYTHLEIWVRIGERDFQLTGELAHRCWDWCRKGRVTRNDNGGEW